MKSYNARTAQVKTLMREGKLLIVIPARLPVGKIIPVSVDYSSDYDGPRNVKVLSDFCPLGTVGERFKLRETWALQSELLGHGEECDIYCYKADENKRGWRYKRSWNSPAIMPPEAVRHMPLITSITVKRVGDIVKLSDGNTDYHGENIEATGGYDSFADNPTLWPTIGNYKRNWNARYPKPDEQWPDAQCFFVRCKLEGK